MVRKQLFVGARNVNNVQNMSSPWGYTLGYRQHRVRLSNVDYSRPSVPPRRVPSPSRTVFPVLNKHTGGERRWRNPFINQEEKEHSGREITPVSHPDPQSQHQSLPSSVTKP